MAKLVSLGKVFETEVLVLGGGVSGLWAANRAKEFADDVLVVDKGARDWGGQASRAGGDVEAVLPGENVDDFVKELVYYFDGLCEQDLVEEVLRQSYQRIEDYERLGHKFAREPDGKLKRIPQRGLDHIKCCIYRPYGKGGKHMVKVLVKEADRLGVKRLCRTMVTDLLKQGGQVVGAIGFNIINGEFYIFKANAVVLATGSSGWRSAPQSNAHTGEGMDIALRAGAELKNCEFAQVWNVPKLFMWEGQTVLMPLGAKLINARGETFMDKYSPILGNNTDPHYNVLGMAIEAREGRGPFYLDCSAMKPEDIEITKPAAGWQKLNYDRLIDLGINFYEDKTEWMPQLLMTYEGIIVDIKGLTKVPGLFLAGNWAPEPGVYMGGWNLCRTAVTGHIAGESAGIYARSHRPFQIKKGDVEALKNKLYAPLGKEGITPKEVLTKIREVIFPYDVCILKSETSLKSALSKIEGLKNELLPRMVAKDAHYLMKLIEVRSIALKAERYLRTSLMRTESRAGHYREDYPKRDNANWLKWIVVNQEDSELRLRTEPVPLERYKFKPTRYYMDNFRFPE
jgi:succinate dehydrogenase / fumarate reductase flavoprotein subunit